MAIQDAVSCCRACPGANGPDIRKRVNCAQDAAESALSVITTLLDGASRLVDGRFARVMAVRRPLNPSGEAGKEVRMARPHQGSEDREVLDADDVQRALTRIAHEVLERN